MATIQLAVNFREKRDVALFHRKQTIISAQNEMGWLIYSLVHLKLSVKAKQKMQMKNKSTLQEKVSNSSASLFITSERKDRMIIIITAIWRDTAMSHGQNMRNL